MTTPNPNSIYSAFKTDKKAENEGVWLEYGEFRVKVLRAGGSNKHFLKVLEQKTRPFQRAIKTETIELSQKVLSEVYVDAIIVGWETKIDGEWQKVIVTETGEVVPATKESITAILEALPEIFIDIQEMAGKMSLFREVVLEENGGN